METNLLNEINNILCKLYLENILPVSESNTRSLQKKFVSVLDQYYESKQIVSYSVFPIESSNVVSLTVSIKLDHNSEYDVVNYSNLTVREKLSSTDKEESYIDVIGKSNFAKYKNNFYDTEVMYPAA